MKKTQLPHKTCATCGRPFSWRKKWEKYWNEVKYCSKQCKGGWQGKVGNRKKLILGKEPDLITDRR